MESKNTKNEQRRLFLKIRHAIQPSENIEELKQKEEPEKFDYARSVLSI